MRQEDVEKHLLSEFAELVSPSPDVIAWVKETLRAKYEADMEARIALKKQLSDRHQQLGRRTEIMYEDRLDGRLSVHQYDKMHKEASNEQKIISKKLEDFEETTWQSWNVASTCSIYPKKRPQSTNSRTIQTVEPFCAIYFRTSI
ncbi:MAG TPA: hypothetical protein VMY99_04585 [Nevskiaceae bacterium]|nr:hypothetical protein [Nevskiaceae bacterium]